MKYSQLIFSPTGGTQKVAEVISSEWSKDIESVDLSKPNVDFSTYNFCSDDCVLIALPSYGGRVPSLAAERLSRVQGNNARCVLLCVYGNRAYEDTLVEMEDIAKSCGFIVIAAISAIAEHSIMHQYATGRPDREDMLQLRSYAKSILEKLKPGVTDKGPNIPGNRPYKKAGSAGLVPKATSECVKCGICAERCPAQAITTTNIGSADSQKCISCMRCVAICPHSARKANGVMISIASLAIKKACVKRKDCELFI